MTTFIYNALHNKKIYVYGDGTVIRDYIYISDVIDAILNIMEGDTEYRIYNVGSGKGIHLNKIIDIINTELGMSTEVEYLGGRDVDVPVNYLDISRYEREFGKLEKTPLILGMKKTMNFLERTTRGWS